MNIYDFLFIVQLLVLIGIFLYKLYNILNIGKIYDYKYGVILFVSFLIAWFVGFAIFMFQPERLIYSILFRFGSFLLAINMLFMIIEIGIQIVDVSPKYIDSYKGIEHKG